MIGGTNRLLLMIHIQQVVQKNPSDFKNGQRMVVNGGVAGIHHDFGISIVQVCAVEGYNAVARFREPG